MMLKTLLPLLLGALVGVILVLHQDVAPSGGETAAGSASPFATTIEASLETSTEGQPPVGAVQPSRSVDRSSADVAEAVREALAVGLASEQRAALVRIALSAADVDPIAALAAAAQIESFEMRDAYRAAVYVAWGRRDPAAMLAFVAANPLETFPDERFFIGAAETDAALVVAMLPRLPKSARFRAERAAIAVSAAMLEELAFEDPGTALRSLEDHPSDRDELLRAVARGYARNDLAGTLAWLHSLPMRSPSAIAAALASIAEIDPDAAAAALVDELLRIERVDIPIANVVAALMGASHATLSGFADRLAAADDVRVRAAYQPFLSAWASSDFAAASAWVLDNLDRVPEASIESVVRSQAARDVAATRRLVDAFNADLRAVGIRAAAPVLARADFAEAVRWVATLRGQPGFREALEALTSGVTAANVSLVTSAGSTAFEPLLAEESAMLVARLAPVAAALLARSDPAAAARWVLDLDPGAEHAERRSAALRNVARLWASQDVAGVTAWVLSLPRGDDRDEALRIVVPQAASGGIAPDRLLDAFASTTSRETSLLDAVAALANRDAAAAKRLIEREVADPELRKRAETRLVEGAAGWPSSGGGVTQIER